MIPHIAYRIVRNIVIPVFAYRNLYGIHYPEPQCDNGNSQIARLVENSSKIEPILRKNKSILSFIIMSAIWVMQFLSAPASHKCIPSMLFFTLFFKLLLAIPTTALYPSNSSSNLTGSAFLSSPSPLKLTFDLHGPQIPSPAVNAAFNGAITRIHPFVQTQPNNRIQNNNFQFRTVGGSVQIGVTGAPRHQVSWQQLDSVLRQAASFINGDLGTGRPHMQELSFEIIHGETTIGDGLVTYRPLGELQSGQSTLANLTNPNSTGLLLSATDPSLYTPTVNGILYPIPGTPFTLSFRFFGVAIPTSNVSAAFEGAHSEILGFLVRDPYSPIPPVGFDYFQEAVSITVTAYGVIIMTWTQLSAVLGGMYGFMMGTPEHYQVLACDVLCTGHGSVGLASISYFPPSPKVTE